MITKKIYGIFTEGYDPDGNEIDEFQYEAFENEADAVAFVKENQKRCCNRLFYAEIDFHCRKENS